MTTNKTPEQIAREIRLAVFPFDGVYSSACLTKIEDAIVDAICQEREAKVQDSVSDEELWAEAWRRYPQREINSRAEMAQILNRERFVEDAKTKRKNKEGV